MKKEVFIMIFTLSSLACFKIKAQDNGYGSLLWGSDVKELYRQYPTAVIAYNPEWGFFRTTDGEKNRQFNSRYNLLVSEDFAKYRNNTIVYSEKPISGYTEHEDCRFFFYKDNKLFKVWYQLNINTSDYTGVLDTLKSKYGNYAKVDSGNIDGGWDISVYFWNFSNTLHIKYGTKHYGTYRSWGYVFYYNPLVEQEIDNNNKKKLNERIQL